MKTAAVFLADGFEEVEALTPVDYLRRAGIEVITVGLVGKPFNKSMIVTGARNIPVVADISFNEYLSRFSSDLPDLIFCPGGLKGAENLAASSELLNHIELCNKAGKFVCAICASPALVFGKTSVLENRKWTCYPGMADETKSEYSKNYSDCVFITDGNLITARGAGAAEEMSIELIRLLTDMETAQKIRKSTVQR